MSEPELQRQVKMLNALCHRLMDERLGEDGALELVRWARSEAARAARYRRVVRATWKYFNEADRRKRPTHDQLMFSIDKVLEE